MPNNDPKPRWQELYAAACVETDREKLTTLIHRIEEALLQRGQELGQDADDLAERNAMAQASRTLLAMKVDKLGWPPVAMK